MRRLTLPQPTGLQAAWLLPYSHAIAKRRTHTVSAGYHA